MQAAATSIADVVDAPLQVLPADRRHASPYPGFRPFDYDDADLFYGRKKQVDQLLGSLQSRFVAVLGPSGCGKSSLVRAGVLPGLQLGFRTALATRWRIAQVRPGGSPIARLAEALLAPAALGEEWGTDGSALGFLTATLRRGALGLVEAVREAQLPAGVGLVLLVDQFEELFRYQSRAGQDDSQAFVALLARTVEETAAPIHIVMTMRSDFLGACTRFSGLPELVSQGMFLTPRLTRDQCAEAIVTPARLFHGNVDDALVNQLLNDTFAMVDPLPPLQHVLMRMWALAAGGKQGTHPRLTLDHYQDVGRIEQALSNHANEAYADLKDDDDRKVAEILFRSLVDVGQDGQKVRQSLSVGEIADRAGVDVEAVDRVVAPFTAEGRSFLVRSGPSAPNGDAVLDIAHESLIRSWDRLIAWSDDEARWLRSRRLLREAAKQWDELQRDPQWLFRGRRLRDIGEVAVRYGNLTPIEVEFQAASRLAVLSASTDATADSTKRKPLRRIALDVLTGKVVIFELLTKAVIAHFFGKAPVVRQPLVVDDGYPLDAVLLHTQNDAKAADWVEKFLDTFHLVAAFESDLSLRKFRIWPLLVDELGDDKALDRLTDARHLLLVCSADATAHMDAMNRAVRAFVTKRPRDAIAALLLDGATAKSPKGVLPPASFKRDGTPPDVFDLRKKRDRKYRIVPDREMVGVAARLNEGLDRGVAERYWLLAQIHNVGRIAFRYVLPVIAVILSLLAILASVHSESRKQNEQIAELNKVAVEKEAAAKRHQTATDEARALDTEAASAAKEGRTNVAIQKYQELLRKLDADKALPLDEPATQASLADLYYLMKDYPRAIDAYTASIEGGLKTAASFYQRGRARMEKKAFAEADADFTACIGIDASNYRAYLQRGIVRRMLKVFPQAIDDLSTAVDKADSPREERSATETARNVLLEIESNEASWASTASAALSKLKNTARLYLHHVKGTELEASCVSKGLTDAAFAVLEVSPNSMQREWVINYFTVTDRELANDLANEFADGAVACGLLPRPRPVLKFVESKAYQEGMFGVWMPKVARPAVGANPTAD